MLSRRQWEGETREEEELVRITDPESKCLSKGVFLQTILSVEECKTTFVSFFFFEDKLKIQLSCAKSPQFSNLGTHSKLFFSE